MLAAAFAIGSAAHRGGRRALGAQARKLPFRTKLVHLSAWQLGLFVGMEIVERVTAGVPPTILLHDTSFAVGVLLQVVVAAAVLVVIRAVEEVAERVVRRLQARVSPARRRTVPAKAQTVRSRRLILVAAPRGPPAPFPG